MGLLSLVLMKCKSSTWREGKAIHFALTSFKALVQSLYIKRHSDNQGAVGIVDVGSPNAELQLAISWISMTDI